MQFRSERSDDATNIALQLGAGDQVSRLTRGEPQPLLSAEGSGEPSRHRIGFVIEGKRSSEQTLLRATAPSDGRRTVTGKQIKDCTVTGKDVKNRSLGAAKLSVGALGSLAGERGPTGPQGAPGPKGDLGKQGPIGPAVVREGIVVTR